MHGQSETHLHLSLNFTSILKRHLTQNIFLPFILVTFYHNLWTCQALVLSGSISISTGTFIMQVF